MKNKIKKICFLKNKNGYTLIYTMTAMLICCTLVFSILTMSLYYNNNLGRKIGARGATYSAQNGIEVTEAFMQYCYKNAKITKQATSGNLYNALSNWLDETYTSSSSVGGSDLTGLVLQGYANYEYSTDTNRQITAQLLADKQVNSSYKVYYSKALKNDLKSRGELTLLSVGEYVLNGKSYYKYVTTTVLIQPIYGNNNLIDNFEFKIIEYNETIKGGSELWGNIQW